MKNIIKQILQFLLFEIKEIFSIFFRTLWKVSFVASALVFVTLLALVFTQGSKESAGSLLTILLEILIIAVLSIVYALPVGCFSGLFRILWRLCGGWILVPVITIPLFIILSFYLFSGYLSNEALEVLTALKASAQKNGLQVTSKILGSGGGVHAGPIAVIFLILILPFLIVDIIIIFIDPGFVLQFFWFIFCFILVTIIGFIPSSLSSIILLTIAFFTRLKERFYQFKQLAAQA